MKQVMKLVRHTVRLPVPLDTALRALAGRQGLSPYAMLQRCVKAGVAALANPPDHGLASGELVTELVSVGTRIADIEHILDRALFTACAAYCYARSAALNEPTTEDIISEEIHEAYDRQQRLARGKGA